MRSWPSPSTRRSMAYFVRSRRLGSKSSASIEFETSTTSISSTPSAFCSRSFEPACGRAAASASSPTAPTKSRNLSRKRPGAVSGARSPSNAGAAKRAMRRRRSRSDSQPSATSAGTAASSHRKCGLANRNMIYGIFRKTKCDSRNSAASSTRAASTHRTNSSW